MHQPIYKNMTILDRSLRGKVNEITNIVVKEKNSLS
jgi:hypothetical protein